MPWTQPRQPLAGGELYLQQLEQTETALTLAVSRTTEQTWALVTLELGAAFTATHWELLRVSAALSWAEVYSIIKENPCSMKHKVDLTQREQQIFEQLCHGRSNEEIGSNLYISERTVKFHVSNLMKKFGVDNRLQLVISQTKAHLYAHKKAA